MNPPQDPRRPPRPFDRNRPDDRRSNNFRDDRRPRDDRSGPPQGQGNPNQGRGNPSYGQGNPNQGRGNPSYGQGNPNQGRGNPSYGQGNPNQGRGNPSYGQGNPNQGRGNPNQGRGRDVRPPEAPRPGHLQQQVRPGDPTPFELFCAYHLGITKDGSYKPANIHSVARQFNKPAGELKQLLQNYGLNAMAVMERDFDMAMAQIDMQLAPEGINKVELARPLFEEFLAAPRKKIDWKRIIDEDIRENAKVFGRRD
ncbi:MAG: hypothetical protein SGI90_11915 [Candidatus Eisenbacteria bacterium]|nr:hypothetical protein [Candidatus Eisenbacteria bacterium]